MKKLDDSAPHEVMLVLDAGTGQNALSQAKRSGGNCVVSVDAVKRLDNESLD